MARGGKLNRRDSMIVIATFALLLTGCGDQERPATSIFRVHADQYRREVITVSLALHDALSREVAAKGRALIDVFQIASTDSNGVVHRDTLFQFTRDVEKSDFTMHEMLLGNAMLMCDLGRITYADIVKWESEQVGTPAALDTNKIAEVRVRFVTSGGDTLENTSLRFGLKPMPPNGWLAKDE